MLKFLKDMNAQQLHQFKYPPDNHVDSHTDSESSVSMEEPYTLPYEHLECGVNIQLLGEIVESGARCEQNSEAEQKEEELIRILAVLQAGELYYNNSLCFINLLTCRS